MRCKLAIFEKDLGYIRGLLRYFKITENNTFDSTYFTDRNSLDKYLLVNRIDLLLISDKLFFNELEEYGDMVKIILSDNIIESKLIKYPRINKYQSAEVIVNQLVKIFSSLTTKEIVEHNIKQKEMIGIYSPSGGSGKTIISIAIGKILAKSYLKTLFISTEQIPSYGRYFNYNGDNTFSDMIYHIKGKKNNWLMKLDGIKQIDKSNLEFFAPHLYSEDISELSIKEWEEFIEYIMTYSKYERVIIDLTSELSMRNKLLIKKCDMLILLANNSYSSIEKNKFLNNEMLKKENLNKHTIEVLNNNFQFDLAFEENCYRNFKYIVPYEEDLYIYEDNYIDLKLDNKFGQTLKQLLIKEQVN